MIAKVVRKFQTAGVRGVLEAVYRNLFSPATHPVNVAVDTIMEKPDFSVIQLGAFVGDTDNDPLFEKLRKRLQEANGKLIVVEPVKEFYDQLVKNYEGIPGVAFENVAISDRSGPASFYRLGVDPVAHGYPAWLSQLSSLKEERMTKLWDQFEKDQNFKSFYLQHRIKETVQCMTFSELVSRHNLASLDLLQMDVEGYEFEILRTIDFGEFPVRFVNYERVLLHQTKSQARELMTRWGYRLINYSLDTFCYRPEDRHLAKRWSRYSRARRRLPAT